MRAAEAELFHPSQLEGTVVPVHGTLASVKVPQGSGAYIVAYHHQCVNMCMNR